MERPTSKKNGIGGPTGRTVGSWHAVYRCAMRKDASSDGMGRTRTSKIERRPKRNCDESRGNYSVHRKRSGAGSRATCMTPPRNTDRKSTRLNSSHVEISYAVFCLKKK